MLFFGSVKDNIVLGAPYVDDAMMLRAAEIAGVTEFVNRHPQGFDMQIGERGEGLSGGQRQSVANARALLLDPPSSSWTSQQFARQSFRRKFQETSRRPPRQTYIIAGNTPCIAFDTRRSSDCHG